MAKPTGWVKEPVRHGLASKGIRTNGARAHAAMGKAIKLQQKQVMHENKLRKAARDEEQYELYDIYDEIDSGNLRDVIAENVRFALVREGLIPPDEDPASRAWSVIVPAGGGSYRPEDEDAGEFGYAGGRFEVFLGDKIIAYGEAGGTVAPDLLDLEVWMTEEGE